MFKICKCISDAPIKSILDHSTFQSLNKPMKVIKRGSVDGEGGPIAPALAAPHVAPHPVTHMVARPGSSMGASHSAREEEKLCLF